MTEVVEVRIDPTNADQARAWDGDKGRVLGRQRRTVRLVSRQLHWPLLAAASVSQSDRVLDIGDGTGADHSRRRPER